MQTWLRVWRTIEDALRRWAFFSTQVHRYQFANNMTYITSDINECTSTENPHDCVDLATCKNMLGSYYCKCPRGFKGDGEKSGDGCTGVYRILIWSILSHHRVYLVAFVQFFLLFLLKPRHYQLQIWMSVKLIIRARILERAWTWWQKQKPMNATYVNVYRAIERALTLYTALVSYLEYLIITRSGTNSCSNYKAFDLTVVNYDALVSQNKNVALRRSCQNAVPLAPASNFWTKKAMAKSTSQQRRKRRKSVNFAAMTDMRGTTQKLNACPITRTVAWALMATANSSIPLLVSVSKAWWGQPALSCM